jgi:hypothetical protein
MDGLQCSIMFVSSTATCRQTLLLSEEATAHPDVEADRNACCDLQLNAEAQRAAAWQLRQQAVLQAVAARPAAASSDKATLQYSHAACIHKGEISYRLF